MSENQGNLGKAFAGVGLGAVLALACIVFLFFNEQQSANMYRAANEASKAAITVDATPVNSANENKLVCVSGTLSYSGKASDDTYNISSPTYGLRRKAEMYQWQQKSNTQKAGDKTETTYTYEQVWSETKIDSSNFKEQGHENPPMDSQSKSFYSKDTKLGDFLVSASDLDMLKTVSPLDIPDDISFGDGYKKDGNYITNVSAQPKIGDIRVSFSYPTAADITVLAKQSGNSLVDYTAKSGSVLNKAEEGKKTLQEVVGDIKSENSASTWKLRGMLLGGIILGFMLVLGPLSMLASYIPFFGRFAGGVFVFASILIGGAIGLVTIAVSWIAVRPALSYGILAMALVLLIVGLVSRKKQRNIIRAY